MKLGRAGHRTSAVLDGWMSYEQAPSGLSAPIDCDGDVLRVACGARLIERSTFYER